MAEVWQEIMASSTDLRPLLRFCRHDLAIAARILVIRDLDLFVMHRISKPLVTPQAPLKHPLQHRDSQVGIVIDRDLLFPSRAAGTPCHPHVSLKA